MQSNRRPVSTALTPEQIAESISTATVRAPEPVARYALGLGDDALILAQRLGEWIANGPEIEEDIALGNIGLDLLGHARSLLTYAGSAWGKTEDDLAYFRDESEFRCRQIFEQSNDDFAHTIARQLYVSVYFDSLYRALTESTDTTLAAIAAKAVKEVEYHLDHSVQWLLRLGLGTDESRRHMQAALDDFWPFVGELFAADPAASALESQGVAPDPASLRPPFDALVPRLIRDAGLTVPEGKTVRGGGRSGVHSEAFGHLLAEMQVLARSHPGATW
jgi:ring-1,2-phenylacetyl-CoA epoxidase subunit PaaC